jgi:hypothetical protein
VAPKFTGWHLDSLTIRQNVEHRKYQRRHDQTYVRHARPERIAAFLELRQNSPTARPEEPTIHYNLACYECQLGNLSGAKQHLIKATKADEKFKLMALDDPDLEPLWAEVDQIEI